MDKQFFVENGKDPAKKAYVGSLLVNGVYERRVRPDQYLRIRDSYTMDYLVYRELELSGQCTTVKYVLSNGDTQVSLFSDWVLYSTDYQAKKGQAKRCLHISRWTKETKQK